MSTMTLAVIILVVMVLGILVTAFLFFLFKHAQYMREAPNKVKCVFFPQTGSTYNKTIDVESAESVSVIKAPKGHKLPYYFYNKQNTWNTRYPDNPFLGITAIQVPIATVWYFEDNPEPITSHPSEPLATSTMIFAAIDSAFALVVQELDAELQKTKKQLLEALMTKLNKTVVYAGLVIIIIGIIVDIVIGSVNASHMGKITEIQNALNRLGIR